MVKKKSFQEHLDKIMGDTLLEYIKTHLNYKDKMDYYNKTKDKR